MITPGSSPNKQNIKNFYFIFLEFVLIQYWISVFTFR